MNSPQALVEAYFDRGLSPEETLQLRRWLAESEEHRRSFARDAMLYLGLPDALHEATLSEEISDQALLRSLDAESVGGASDFMELLQSLSPDDEPLPVVDITSRVMEEVAQARYEARRERALQQARRALPETKPSGAPAWAIYCGAIAACLTVAVIVWKPSAPNAPSASTPPPVVETHRPTHNTPPASPQPIATILSTVRAVGPEGAALLAEQSLYEGDFTIDSGLAQLAFANGAVVTLEGPARLRLIDAGRLALDSGELFARSEAGQFVVETPRGVVTDLGTSFGVSYTEDRLEAHAFEGKVEVLRTDMPGQAPVALRAGGALSIDDRHLARSPRPPSENDAPRPDPVRR